MKKERKSYTLAQKREYVKLMIEEGYSLEEVQRISGACESVVNRWKHQYQSLTPEHQRIQELER